MDAPSSAPDAGLIYFAREGEIFGPYRAAQVESFRQRGELGRFAWRWEAVLGIWMPALEPPTGPPGDKGVPAAAPAPSGVAGRDRCQLLRADGQGTLWRGWANLEDDPAGSAIGFMIPRADRAVGVPGVGILAWLVAELGPRQPASTARAPTLTKVSHLERDSDGGWVVWLDRQG